ncbi:uncharacterized protein LOC122928975 isoform X3 [Bufo gargarizans]|uniref:uncharacterized protein LOC122928975 isoform X3 n=1 Tax=Bufo gargarizans TaxID=30331 RepID=UPI001CF34BAE|nr:uncharacterized protein LOC122928975 isoform X3 [Bufo gargarizans]
MQIYVQTPNLALINVAPGVRSCPTVITGAFPRARTVTCGIFSFYQKRHGLLQIICCLLACTLAVGGAQSSRFELSSEQLSWSHFCM